jgi:Flp pilus assembly protein TadD
MARANYERGIAYAAASEFHFAVELLDQAVRADPRAEYWVALGRVQARNPNWRGRAIESYRAALELEPDNAEVRFALGLLYEQTEDPERARVQFAAVVRLNPAHAEAAERLAKLEPKRGGRTAGGSLFDRIFRRN